MIADGDDGGGAAGAGRRRMIHGRRRGRKLRAGQAGLMATLLPRLRLELAENATLDPAAPFGPEFRRFALEIGFGAGEHLAAEAAAHPETGFLGVEIYENGVARLLAEIAAQGLGNIRLVIDDARLVLAALPAASLDAVYILFPDPWPKLRHQKRRLVAPATLAQLARAMRPGAELRLASDDMEYARDMLADALAVPAFRWLARRADDWRQRPADWPPTRYEAKARKADRRPLYLRFVRR
ncbi:MAG: tRNA (guanosine(46)-N7)-methyltransferase TrmB [Stellaceae bacterium]